MILNSSLPPAIKTPQSSFSTTSSARTWCAYNTSTYIIITPGAALSPVKLNTTLINGASYIQDYLMEHGDGDVIGDQVRFSAFADLGLTINKASGKKLKWSMLKDAVGELLDWMTTTSTWEGAQFFVFHGSNQVGSGVVQAQQLEP